MNVNDIIKISNDINKVFKEFNDNVSANDNSYIFKHLKRVEIAQFIIPFLSFDDICAFRLSCKDFYSLLNERIALFSYAKSIKDKSGSRHIKVDLKPLDELRNENDLMTQIDFLHKIKNYISSPHFEMENLLKIYRVENDYLKYEQKRGDKILKKLNETLMQIKEEYNETKSTNNEITKQKENSNRNTSNELDNKSIDDIKRDIDSLKLEKSKLTNTVYQLRKSNQDIESKLQIKNESLIKLRNFFAITEPHTKYLSIQFPKIE